MKDFLTEWKKFLKEEIESIDSENGRIEYRIDDGCICLDSISVDEDKRGKGLGKKLFNELLDKAKELKIKKIYAEQHDLDGRVYRIFKSVPNAEVNSFLSQREADKNDIDYSAEDKVEHPYFKKVIKIDDPTDYAPVFLELLLK